mgnify:FL=1
MMFDEDFATIQPGDALPLIDFSALDEVLQDFDTFVNSPNPL